MITNEQKMAGAENESVAMSDYNEAARDLLKNLCNWRTMPEFRKFLMEMYTHTVGSDQYREMSHADQLSKAMMLHRLTDFLEQVEEWDLKDVLVRN